MSTQMSLRATRIIDPILSTVVQGYKHPDYVGYNLFPAVPVQQSGGQVLQFGKEDFRLLNTQRAPGGTIKRVQYGHLGVPFALENHALAGQVPYELMRDAKAVPHIDLGSRAIRRTLKSNLFQLEYRQAQIATNAANYPAANKITLTGTSKWSDPASNPLAQVETAKEAIRSGCGVRPNVFIIAAVAFAALRQNPSIQDKIKYTQTGVVTAELLAGLFGVKKVIVADAVVASGAADTFSDVWGNNAVLAYVPQEDQAIEEPSYGYTYTMEGHPAAYEPWNDKDSDSWIYPIKFERVPVLSGVTTGYLFQNPA